MARRKEAKEKYLRTIYKLQEHEKAGVKSIEIARELGISKPSVYEMLRKMSKENLVKINPYSKVFLTLRGIKQAGKLFDNHFTIKKFMKNILKHDDEKAESEAGKISHILSDDTIKIIENLMEDRFDTETPLKPSPSYIG